MSSAFHRLILLGGSASANRPLLPAQQSSLPPQPTDHTGVQVSLGQVPPSSQSQRPRSKLLCCQRALNKLHRIILMLPTPSPVITATHQEHAWKGIRDNGERRHSAGWCLSKDVFCTSNAGPAHKSSTSQVRKASPRVGASLKCGLEGRLCTGVGGGVGLTPSIQVYETFT